MNGGDTDTGGAQVNPSNTPPSNPGPRPVGPVDPSAEDTSMLSISHDQQNPGAGQQPISQPGVQASTPTTTGVAGPSVLPLASNIPSSAIPNTTASPTPVSYPAANINSQPQPQSQPADQLITQTFATSGQPTQTATVSPVTQYVQTSYPQQPVARPSVQYAPDDTGDIKLTSTHPKKSKKGLIIGLIVFVIILITVGTIFVVSYIQSQSGANIHKDSVAIQNKFNKYANYVLYGEDSVEQIQDFKAENVYAIDENINNNSFLKNANNLYSAFLEDFIGSDYDGKVSTSLLSTNEYYNFLIWKNDFSEIDKTELLQIYMDKGLGVAKDYIKNYYNDVDHSNSLVELFAKYDSEYAIYMVEEWAIYDEKGCRQDKSYDTTCIMNITNDEKIQNFAKHLYELEASINYLIPQTIETIKEQLQIYKKVIYGEGDIEEAINKESDFNE